MNKSAAAEYERWQQHAVEDGLNEELAAIRGNEEEIFDRFRKNLEFGTGGLRGVIGAGTNRMNVYTVAQATQGLCNYLAGRQAQSRVVIAHDSRNKSELFAKTAARVLAANGAQVYLFDTLTPTPVLSFAVRYLQAQSGIVITASHNPSKYNGYKCYNAYGYQMTDEEALAVFDCIAQTDVFGGVKTADFDAAAADGSIRYTDDELLEAYYAAVLGQRVLPGLTDKHPVGIIYTPLNGTGNVPVREILKRSGARDVTVVPSQENPDGSFPTCPYPNPEIPEAFAEAFRLAKDNPAELIIATDPDCDRMGIAVPDGDGYRLLTGNETACMLAYYLLSNKKLPERPVLIKSIVTTPLLETIATDFGATVTNILTGFKYIGEEITRLESIGEADRFVFGCEESYGYLAGTHVRDKDAVVSAMLIAETASWCKSRGMTLAELMREIYEKYGYYQSRLINLQFEGADGMDKMKGILSALRERPAQSLAEIPVVFVSDYLNSVRTDLKTNSRTAISLPRSDVMEFGLRGGHDVVFRPSGTEPKLKIYITASGADPLSAEATAEKLGKAAEELIHK